MKGEYMYILVIVLSKVDALDELLESFMAYGVHGATIIDSQGMASALVETHPQSVPFIGRLRSFIDTSRPYNKTIFTILPDREMVEIALKAFNESVGPINDEGNGFAFTMRIDDVFGFKEHSIHGGK